MFKLAFFFSLLTSACFSFATPKTTKAKPHVSKAVAKPVAQPKIAVAPKVEIKPAKLVADARHFYAAGNYVQAARQYEMIPTNSDEYLRTREELAWTYLRAEDWTRLRGILKDVNSKLVPLRWRLEGRVLSAMVHLQDCQYDSVKNDVELFQQEMAPLAHEVDRKIASNAHPHFWRALQAEVGEAIFKMKFVRMELRSRLVMLTRQQVIELPDTKPSTEQIKAEMQVYPVDGDIWADEIFEKRGESKSICAALHKAKVIQ